MQTSKKKIKAYYYLEVDYDNPEEVKELTAKINRFFISTGLTSGFKPDKTGDGVFLR